MGKKLSKFNERFIKGYDENSDKVYFLDVDVEYPKNLFNRVVLNLHKDLPFLPEIKKITKCNKLVCNIQDKEIYVVHIKALKQALNHGLKLKTVQRVIRFNQKAWLEPYIDMNTKLRKEAKNGFEKGFLKLMNNSVFGKTVENIRKHRNIKLVTTDKRRNQLASEPNYRATKYFSENLMAIEMKKTKVKMNKPIYLGMSILDISKTLMYEFWYDCIKPAYQQSCTKQSCAQGRTQLSYMDTYSFVIHIITEDSYEDIANDVENGLTHLTMTKTIEDPFQ